MRAKTANVLQPVKAHSVAIAVYDEVSLFELSVACRIFGDQLDDDYGVAWYDLAICGAGGRGSSVRANRNLRVDVTHGLRRLSQADTVIVPPCDDRAVRYDPPAALLQAIRRAHARGARVVSLCTGAFIVAATGLLDGRRATTHWAECADLARRHPAVDVDPDVLYVDNRDVLTSAGSAASIDLCLHLVRTDHGAEVAADLARELVVAPYRDGGQAQYIRTPLPDPRTDDLFTGTLAWLHDNLHEQHTVAELARRAAMSPRTFARRFVDSTGTTPYQWLTRQRVQLAQRLLETTDEPVESIATASGFVTANNLRKHFARAVRTTPGAYRRTFGRSTQQAAG